MGRLAASCSVCAGLKHPVGAHQLGQCSTAENALHLALRFEPDGVDSADLAAGTIVGIYSAIVDRQVQRLEDVQNEMFPAAAQV